MRPTLRSLGSLTFLLVVAALAGCAGKLDTDDPARDAGTAAPGEDASTVDSGTEPTPDPTDSGTLTADAGTTVDVDAGTTPDGGSGEEPPGPLDECPGGMSVDRIQQWNAGGEGATVPMTGTLLAQDGGEYVARVQFLEPPPAPNNWHVISTFIANQWDTEADLSESRGFWLTYSATHDFWVQVRPRSAWSGGVKWFHAIPSTGGRVETHFFSFDPDDWEPYFGTPPHTLEQALGEVMGFVFVGNAANQITFRGLRIDGYTPPCR